ncbi:ABC transporter ATP-binding protein [Lactiplantibacillus garii]|uniref:ABC transporter ATP-binding protein n=1 Tax=Lactiplantibacillus garii TaxID=2306423 RepID=A0A426D766_9LACO|nr:ATP-binding cassette domain-containing protein [Lactiplantibacillus garii]RRK10436.1 ABC transporter ATP-binding protein [Lactiplantibacillus garii]
MTEIKLSYVQKLIAGRPLFTIQSLTASDSAHIGIVGRNGAGKSTLAHMLTGEDHDFEGQLIVNAPVVYVPQIAPTFEQSGGQAMLARVRAALNKRPEILILDEPSSNLDETHQDWLAKQLRQFRGLLLLISHDRQLLNAVTTETWAVANQEFQAYPGNYAQYQAITRQQLATQEAAYTRQHRHLQDLKKATQARHEKAQRIRKGSSRMTAAERANSKSLREATAAKMDRSAKKLVERGEREVTVAKPFTQSGFKLVATDFPRFTGKTVVTALNVTLAAYGKTLLTRATFQIKPGARVALVGPNGSGKTTLLEAVLAGQTRGLTLAPAAKVGVFNQDMTALNGELTVWQTVRRASNLPDQTIRNVLGALGLPARFYPQLVAELSGGELVKLQLVRILVGNYNVLMLDEPTNYLDVDALDALADYLQNYPGTVIFVSHDEPFRTAVATRTLTLKHQQLVDPNTVPHRAQSATVDLPLLRFKYDQLMADSNAKTADIQALKRKIDAATKN